MQRCLNALLLLALALLCCGCTPQSAPGGETSAAAALLKKETLALEHTIDLDTEQGQTVEKLPVEITLTGLEETDWTNAENVFAVQPLLEAYRKMDQNLNPAKWSVHIHAYNVADDTWGIALRCQPNERILVNKAITCTAEHGKVRTLYCSNSGFEITDSKERELLERIARFENTHTQARMEFSPGQKFVSEAVQYVYYPNVDALVYHYALVLEVDDGAAGTINSTIGSDYIVP